MVFKSHMEFIWLMKLMYGKKTVPSRLEKYVRTHCLWGLWDRKTGQELTIRAGRKSCKIAGSHAKQQLSGGRCFPLPAGKHGVEGRACIRHGTKIEASLGGQAAAQTQPLHLCPCSWCMCLRASAMGLQCAPGLQDHIIHYILPVKEGVLLLFPWHFSSAGKGRMVARTWLFTFTSWCEHIITWLKELRLWEKHQMFMCPEIKLRFSSNATWSARSWWVGHN